MKILCVYSPDFKLLSDITIPLWEEYCRLHGYELHTYISSSLGHLAQFHYSFFKMQAVLDVLLKQPVFEPMLIIDVDMIPTNFASRIGNACSEMQDITIGRDINGLNSASFFLFRTSIAEQWLRSIISLRHHTTSEQHAMWWLEEAYEPYTKYVEGINSIPYHEYEGFGFQKKDHYSQWEPGHLTCHLPGCSNDFRIKTFQKYIPQIVR